MSFLPYGSGGPLGWIAAMGSSGVVHVLAIVAIVGGIPGLLDSAEPAPPPPDFTITLERLDSDTIAGLIEQKGVAGAEAETPSDTAEPVPETEAEELAALEPETLEPADVETPEPEQPETLEGTEPDALEGMEPETVEAAEPDALEGSEPDAIEPVTEDAPEPELPEPTTAEALAPETATVAEALAPESLAALAPTTPVSPLEPLSPITSDNAAPALQPLDASPLIPETLSAAGATAVQPVSPAAETLNTVVPVTSPQSALRPTGPQAERATIAAVNRTPAPPPSPQPTPAAQPPAPQSAQDLAIGDLIRRIRSAPSDACLLALPRRDGEDGVGLAMIAGTDTAMTDFTDTVLTADDADIRQTRTLIDPRQCPAMTYVRQNQDYPATRLGLRLDAGEVPSGGRLTGVLRGAAGRYVLLLLVDNNGVVQDLQRFVSFSGNFARFDVPVTRVGVPRDTSQLLLAIATRRPPSVIRERIGQLAQDVFANLGGELAGGAALAITTFDVR